MIFNSNKIVLEDSGLELESSIIVVSAFSGDNSKAESSTVTLQINFYSSGEKFLANVNNALNVKGFDKSDKRLTFEYPVTDRNVFLYFDVMVKEYIQTVFPEFDPKLLVLTTEEV